MTQGTFPVLYKQSATGALQQWEIYATQKMGLSGALIVTTYGQVGGQMQTTTDTVTEGKNVGKVNETTPYEQACKEAEAKWLLQKKKKGYVESVEEAKAGVVDAVVEGGIFPMLADKFATKGDRVQYPAYAQPKLDGHRCIAIVKDGACTLWSRTRKPINSVPHVNAAVLELTAGQDAVLDGELYNHNLKAEFERLTSAIRKDEPSEQSALVEYHIYDFPSAGGGFAERYRLLNKLFELAPKDTTSALVQVDTFLASDEDDVMSYFEEFLTSGYEGAMVRTRDGEYLQHPTKRSTGLLKVKEFSDSEYEIVAVKEGRGKMAGKAVFVCDAGNGETFDAKMRGPLEKLKEYWEHPEKYVGQMLTVQYQGLTGAKKVPRFPVALRFREDL